MGRGKNEIESSKAYMRYALAFLSKNPDKIQKFGFNSIDDLRIEKNFEKLPAVCQASAFGETISAKTFSAAFRLESAPYDRTLNVIQKQFEIELSFIEFKRKLKERDVSVVPYYADRSTPATVVDKDSTKVKSPLQNEAAPQSSGIQNWFQQYKLALLFSTTVVIIIAVVFVLGPAEQESPKPLNDDFDKKQVEAVLGLYQKLKNCSLEINFIFKGEHSYTSWWVKDSGDYFYESQIKEIPFLQMEDELFDYDSNGIRSMNAEYIKHKGFSGDIKSPRQILDTFAPGVYYVELIVEEDTRLSNQLLISDLAFSSDNILDAEIVEYTRSIYLPDSIKKHLSALTNHQGEWQSLNKILSASLADVMILGRTRTTSRNFTGYTPMHIWKSSAGGSERVHLKDIFLMTNQLEKAIIDFLKSKNVPIN